MSKGFEKVNIHSCGEGVIPVPVIGENGNWYIGNDDTQVRAEGIDGKDGETGAVGPQGDKGDKGDVGSQGEKGEKGDVGPQGEKGNQGDVGPQGVKGDKGDEGPQGDKGEKGDVGPQGATGETPELAANLDTVDTGKALDAAMGKVLDNKITDVNAKLNTGNLDFDYVESDGLYYEVKVGADTVRKKCSSDIKISSIRLDSSGLLPQPVLTANTIEVEGYATLTVTSCTFNGYFPDVYAQISGHTGTDNVLLYSGQSFSNKVFNISNCNTITFTITKQAVNHENGWCIIVFSGIVIS